MEVRQKKVDDGAILVVAKNDRALRIEVGYGLEGALNDATSKRIISEIITPRFKQGDFYGGIAAGLDQMIRVIDGEPLPASNAQTIGGITDIQQYGPLVFILALVIGRVLRPVLGRFPGALVTGGVVAVIAWLVAGALFIALGAGVMALLFTLIGGGMGGYGMGGIVEDSVEAVVVASAEAEAGLAVAAHRGDGKHEYQTHSEPSCYDPLAGQSGFSPRNVDRDRTSDQGQRGCTHRRNPFRC